MYRFIKKALSCLLIAVLVLGAIAPFTDYEVNAASKVTQIYGNTRFDTSIKVANELKKELGLSKFDAVILTRGNYYADAFSASGLSAELKAPILLVDPNLESDFGKKIFTNVVNYIERNLAPKGKIYILGGTSAVPVNYENAYSPAKEYEILRFGGETFYDTNIEILNETDRLHAEKNLGAYDKELIVCKGGNYPDALAAGSLGRPMLLVRDTGLSEEQKAYLAGRGTSNITIIGGPSAVSESILEELKAYGSVDRHFGSTKFDTPVALARKLYGNKPKEVMLITGDNYPDGLCAGPLAYVKKCPILLVGKKYIAPAYNYQINAGKPSVTIIGGSNVINKNAAASGTAFKKGWNKYWNDYIYINSNGAVSTAKINDTGFQVTANAGGIVTSSNKSDMERKIDSCSYGTAIVIHLEQQKMDYVRNNKLILTTDVVTGQLRSPTPTGTYWINNKARNTVLTGISLSGNPYEVPVEYWMAFKGSEYGIHDSYYTKKYGGTIYKYNGSLGCVRTPLGAMAKLYSMVAVGTKVVIKKK
ncbi:MAG: cell wall-binding repeat-containing protein [Firmicutes bacterium]|nr:cell wall-binding repeat-containing protein [Bacillota bacterium]